jgi:predicted kinase
MPTLEVLVGMIGSGKTTYARQRADDGALVISLDDLTEMLHARYRYEPELRKCYQQMEHSLAWAGLCAGRDVIIDRTHLTLESRRRWITWAGNFDSMQDYEGKGYHTPVVAIVFPREPALVHARRRFETDARGRSLEEWDLVAAHHEAQAEAEPISDGEGFTAIREVKTDVLPGTLNTRGTDSPASREGETVHRIRPRS